MTIIDLPEQTPTITLYIQSIGKVCIRDIQQEDKPNIEILPQIRQIRSRALFPPVSNNMRVGNSYSVFVCMFLKRLMFFLPFMN